MTVISACAKMPNSKRWLGQLHFFFHSYYFVLFLCCYYGFVGSCLALVLEGQVCMAFSLSAHYSHVCFPPPPPLPLLRAVYLSPAASHCCAVSSFPYIHIYPYVCISVILFYTSVTIEPVCVFVLFLCCCFFFVVYLLLLALLFCSLFFFLIFFSCL